MVLLMVSVLSTAAACSDDSEPNAGPSGRPSRPSIEPAPTPTAASPDVPSSPRASAAPTVTAEPGVNLPPAPLDRPADAGDGVVVSIVRTISVETQGTGPGESSGEPAVAVTLRVQNGSGQSLDLGSTTVALTTGPERTPGRFSEGPPARPLSGQVPTGGTVDGVYVFVLPPGERDDVVLDVGLAPDRPVLQLAGSLD